MERIIRSAGLITLAALGLTAGALRAQDSTVVNLQLWVDGDVRKQLSQRWSGRLLVSARTTVTEPRNWRRLDLRPSVTYSAGAWLDVPVGVLLSRTDQTDDLNSFELRPYLGALIPWTPKPGIKFFSFSRLEFRQFWYSDDTTASSWRFRSRAGFDLAINHRNLLLDRTLVFAADAEAFVDIGEAVAETFANNWNLRVGLIYRLSYAWRFAFWYMIQESLDTVNESFTTADNVLRFRASYYVP